jgi:ABC-type phosphate transport system permease subunit
MAGNTQMNENERGIFKLSGITGMLIATVLLLSILVVLTVNAINVQQNQATNFYKINQKLDGLTSGSWSSDMKQNTAEEQNKNYQLIGNGK